MPGHAREGSVPEVQVQPRPGRGVVSVALSTLLLLDLAAIAFSLAGLSLWLVPVALGILSAAVGAGFVVRALTVRYYAWRLRQIRFSIDVLDDQIAELGGKLKAAGLEDRLSKLPTYLIRRVGSHRWALEHRELTLRLLASLPAFIVASVALVTIFFFTSLVAVAAVVIAIGALSQFRELVQNVFSRTVTYAVALAGLTAYLFVRQSSVLSDGRVPKISEGLTIEQYAVLGLTGAICVAAVSSAVDSLMWQQVDRRQVRIETEYARELCIDQLLSALKQSLLGKPVAATAGDTVESLGNAARHMEQIGFLPPDGLSARQCLAFGDHYKAAAARLRSLQMKLALPKERNDSVVIELCDSVVALTLRHDGALAVAEHEELFAVRSRLRLIVGRLWSLLVAFIPLAFVSLAPRIGLPLVEPLRGSLLVAFGAYAAVSCLMLLDPRVQERTNATQSVFSMISSSPTQQVRVSENDTVPKRTI